MAINQVTVSIENLAPANGTFLTPLWFGFHDGRFDTYDLGRPVSPGLESLAEDGATDLISQEFNLAGLGTKQGLITGQNGIPSSIDPGETATFTLTLDGSLPADRFFSYASKIIPSNDFFIANGNEIAHPIFDAQGNFIGADFVVLGNSVLDAGSEANDEIPANTAFFGQQTPNTGTPENGVVRLANGFTPGGNILSDPQFANANFTAPNFQAARIRVFANNPVFPTAAPVVLSSVLTGNQEVPQPTDSSAFGLSNLRLNETGTALNYDLTVYGLDFGQFLGATPRTAATTDDVTRVHIHAADRGANGNVVFGLIDLVAPAVNNQDADDFRIVENPDGSVTLSGVWEQTDNTASPLSQFVSAIRNVEPGQDLGLYWNVHTTANPGGEIRGQLRQGTVLPADVPSQTIRGGGDNDTLIGALGDDVIRALGGNDRLLGEGGNDRLLGGVGNDRMFGDDGNDILDGGRDNDVAIGGAGEDIFVLSRGRGRVVIRDFTRDDRLQLRGSLDFNDLTITRQGRNTIISNGEDQIARLIGVNIRIVTDDVFV